MGTPNRERQESSSRNLRGIYLPESICVFLRYLWGSLFGVPNPFPVRFELEPLRRPALRFRSSTACWKDAMLNSSRSARISLGEDLGSSLGSQGSEFYSRVYTYR